MVNVTWFCPATMLRAPAPKVIAPSLKVTAPVGVPTPGLTTHARGESRRHDGGGVGLIDRDGCCNRRAAKSRGIGARRGLRGEAAAGSRVGRWSELEASRALRRCDEVVVADRCQAVILI